MARKAKNPEPLVDSEAKKLGYKEGSSQKAMPGSKGPKHDADKDYGRDCYEDSPKLPQHTDKAGNSKKSY